MRPIYFLVTMAILSLAIPEVRAAKIVVLTDKPVAAFTLPDGSVLKNAYVWRRNSEGLMIIHDGGQYFLNYKTLPPEWQAAYMGDAAPVEEDKPAADEEPGNDRYRIENVLKKAPSLAPETRKKLLERGADKELDQGVLVIGLLQAILDNEKDEANRCILYLEERGYEVDDVARDMIFQTCPACGGKGEVPRECRACEGTGECSECAKTASTLGKRSTRTEGKSSDCKVCKESGECAKCGGEGEVGIRCATCSGIGKLAARGYCEVVRDKWVRKMNALVSGNPTASIMASPSVDFESILGELEGINTNAPAYYASTSYNGGMDTNIVVACLMHTLVKKELPLAKRFKMMLDVEYPDNEVIDIENYLQFCQKCKSKGWLKQDCPDCDGSGECPKCEGSGDGMNLKNWKADCSACKGTGECSACQGEGEVSGTCSACMGMGRTFEKSRCKIRCDLLVDELNEYYRKHCSNPM